MKNESKMKNEKRIMNISLIGSILFMLSEGIMAYLTKSHSLLMDCIFDVTDLIMIGPFLLLVPLLYKPVTEKRPYGFSQVESLFVVIKYCVLLAITVRLIWDNILVMMHGGRQVDGGRIAFFELAVCLGCLIIYLLLHYFSRRYASLTIKAEIYIWKLDVISSLGVSIAFFVQMILHRTDYARLAAYIDPVVAIIMACLLLVEPVKMIISNLKSLVLFAPEEEIMDTIRHVAEHHMDKVHYDIEFLDVIQTGRKTWVEIYMTSHNNLINTKILLQLRNEIREELRKSFDQVYVELIPSLPD
ncbi:cation diffusion facilitator family transporter [Jutongia huaianensis]|uniref:cation diffusion facilitator family transporter n=1 Tax=Jutongia huaianensis TaxID=2763668 RepID=UPI0020166080